MPIFLRFVRILLLAGTGFFALILILFATLQTRLIYFPSPGLESDLLNYATKKEIEPWRDASGARIGWRSIHRKAANRLVLFHGNAGDALDRVLLAKSFESIESGHTWDLYLFEYPGYGSRAGKPSEQTIKNAARAAFAELKLEDSRPIFVAGESIGTGVATYLAQTEKVAGLFLITPFTNLGDMASFHYPYLPIRLIMRERYDSVAALKDYRGPVAMVIAGADEIIPAKFGHQLYDGYEGPKRVWVKENARHNTVEFDAREISDYLLKR